MRHLLTRFFACMIVCVGLFISHTHDALALLEPAEPGSEEWFMNHVELCVSNKEIRYFCDTYDYEQEDYQDFIEFDFCYEDYVTLEEVCPYSIVAHNEICSEIPGQTFSGWKELNTGVIYQPGETELPSNDCGFIFLAQYEMVNTVSLTWYNGDTQLTVPSNAQSCEYGGTMTLPPEPTPPAPGLIFDGWTIKVMAQPDCSLLTGLECRSTPGCFKLTGPMCYNLVESCASVTDQETCNKSGQLGRMNCACYWRNGSCVTGGCEPGMM